MFKTWQKTFRDEGAEKGDANGGQREEDGSMSTGRKALETTGESNGSNFSFRTGSASLRRLRGKWGMGHSKDR